MFLVRKVFPVLFLAVVALLAGCGSNKPASPPAGGTVGGPVVTTQPGSSSNSNITIAVIPKGTTHDYWKSVQAGAETAGKKENVQIDWKGPLREDDRAGQIQIVQNFVADNVSGIVLAPLDENALTQPVQAATAKHIPVVIIDSALKGTPGKDFISFVATDNHKGGLLGGERLAKLLKGKGKVVMLRYEEGSASTEAREAGFLDAMKENPGIQIISDNNFGGATMGEAQTKAMQMVDQLKQADGIFCPNESTTLGMLHALQQNNLAGKVKFVGFDTSGPLIDALNAGQIDALVAQNPTKMGYVGVQEIVDKIHGKPVPANVDTGVTVVDKTDLNTPDIQKLLGGTH
jgi:ribose transport system substrate-binding protein